MRLLRAYLTLAIGFGDILGLGSSILGIGSGLKGLFGHGQQGGSSSSRTYVPTGLGAADTTFQNVLNTLTGNIGQGYGTVAPDIAAAYQGLKNAPIGPMYDRLATQATGVGDYLSGLGRGVGDAGAQLWQTSLDPQNALRNQLQQQVVDASRAGTSARGIGMSPESAGIENKAVTDYLLNWNNQQLGRQATGLQGYINASNQAGRNVSGGLDAYGLAPQASAAGASWPMQAASMYAGALQPWNAQYGSILSAIIPYLNSGQGATNQLFGQQQVGLNNLTTGLNQVGKWFSGNPFASVSTSPDYGDWSGGAFGGGAAP